MVESRLPIITLTTDFGTRDHYVAAVKAAILGVTTRVAIVDITHEIAPHDIMEAGWVLRNVFATFPPRTVHVAVVDPGVGTSRRPILAVTENYTFIGPDNGIFSFVFEVEKPVTVVELSAGHYLRSDVSSTFHARDVFAPAAAHRTLGIAPDNFGEPVEDPVLSELPRAKVGPDGTVRASVAHVDRFGNVILNVTRDLMKAYMEQLKATSLTAKAGATTIERMVATYGEAPAGEPFLLFNGDKVGLSPGKD
jgi:S-adenosylmethionine hydrolase